MNSSAVYKNAPAVVATCRVTQGEGKAMARNVNKNVNTDPAKKHVYHHLRWNFSSVSKLLSCTVPKISIEKAQNLINLRRACLVPVVGVKV